MTTWSAPNTRTSSASWYGREHDGVDVDALEIRRRRLRQAAVAVRTRAPGVVDAARIGAEIAAAVHGEDFQLRVAFEHAVEDQIMQRDRRLQRIADDVVEIKARQARRLGETVGMNHHQRAEFFRLFPERREGRIGQFLAGDVGQNLDPGETEFFDAALKLLRRFMAVRHRHRAKALEAVGLLRAERGDAVVDDLRRLDRDVERHRVVALRRRRRDHLHVDAHGVEVGEPPVEAAARADIGFLLLR